MARLKVTIDDIHVAEVEMHVHVDGRDPHCHIIDQMIMGGWNYDKELSQRIFDVIAQHFTGTRYGAWRKDE